MVHVSGNVAEFRFFRPEAANVYLSGDFNHWRPDQLRMTRIEGGFWRARLLLAPGVYSFRYCADGRWYTDYAAFGIEYVPHGCNAVLRIAG